MEDSDDDDVNDDDLEFLLGQRKMTIGKHKGKNYEWLYIHQPSYCEWVLDLEDCSGPMCDFQDYLKQIESKRDRKKRSPSPIRTYRNKKKKVKEKEKKAVQGPDHDELKHDKEADEENGELACVICMTNRRCCITNPCAHMHYCVSCARKLTFGPTEMELKYRGEVKCPECQSDVKSIKRVYF